MAFFWNKFWNENWNDKKVPLQYCRGNPDSIGPKNAPKIGMSWGSCRYLYIYKERELLVGWLVCLSGVAADCSAVCGPIWLKLCWMVGWVMGTIATRWRLDRPPGGAAGV